MIKTRLPERAYLLNLHSILKLKEYQHAIIFPITIAESDLFRSSLQFTGGIFTETVMGIWEALSEKIETKFLKTLSVLFPLQWC